MMKRYEILLPVNYNTGEPIPNFWIEATLQELMGQFGGVTYEPMPLRGMWQDRDKRYIEPMTRVVIAVQDTPANEAWFKWFKSVLKRRFDQLDIWITAQPIAVI